MKPFLSLLLVLGLATLARAHGISEADQHAMVAGGNLRYLWLGAMHMVTGYDHLLFLFGVIFYLSGIKDILKYVTAFTIGHSLTLVFATYAHITADPYLVDAVIALSVCYKAFDNLDGFRKYLKIGAPNPLAMILVFGLIHGFGLSTRLQQLPLPEAGFLPRILSFNVGVELGQIAALSVLVALLEVLRLLRSFKRIGLWANTALLLAGLALCAWQVSQYLRGGHHGHDDHGEAGHGPATHGAEPHGHSQEGDHGDHGHEGGEHGEGPSGGVTDRDLKAWEPATIGPGSDSAPPGPPLRPEAPADHGEQEEHSHDHDHDEGQSHGDGAPHRH